MGLYKDNLNRIIDLIEEQKCVTFAGLTSSGKSTLINKLLDTSLTTSKFNNTTLDFIKLDYLDYTIYDTPGLIVNTDSLDNINYKLIQNKPEYRLIIKDYILDIDSCIGLTLYINGKYKVITKKNSEVLENTYNLNGYVDIVLPGLGFIYVKNSTNIKSNKEDLVIRKSIIGGK